MRFFQRPARAGASTAVTLLLVAATLAATLVHAQLPPQAPNPSQRPKLVVGLVVDQMRWDFLYRYWSSYGDRGFKRLLNEGFAYHQMHYDYVPTYTGPGHAAVYTGAPPAVSGIAGNSWIEMQARGGAKFTGVYCADATHDSVQAVGGAAEAGRMSPQRLLSTTWPDQLKEATLRQSKVIGVAIKDRGAILTTGHSADAAYWVDKATGRWMTSTYYRRALPTWVERFNGRGLIDSLAAQGWAAGRPALNSTSDEQRYEMSLSGRKSFPYTLNSPGDWDPLLTSPHGNTLTLEFALAALSGEALGTDATTDVLAVSLSSPDYAGHRFGPHSQELEDIYVKLDAQLAAFLAQLDQRLGRGNYLFFLTADHGVKPVAEFLQDLKIPAGRFGARTLLAGLEGHLDATYGAADWLLLSNDSIKTSYVYANQQVHLNPTAIAAAKLSADDVARAAADYCRRQPHVAAAYTRQQLIDGHVPSAFKAGFHPRRGGDVQLVYDPGYDDGLSATRAEGTTHGSGYSYDTHVPMLFFGWRVRPGESYRRVGITHIAATVCAMLQIENPNGATGEVLTEAVDATRRR